ITGVRSGCRPKAVNDRSTSVRHHRGSVGVGCTMGHLPASERPRSCSLGTGPFAFSGLALAFAFGASIFYACHQQLAGSPPAGVARCPEDRARGGGAKARERDAVTATNFEADARLSAFVSL